MKIRNIALIIAGIQTSFVSFALGKEKPNVLLIVLDDAGYNDFGFMGCKDILTPNIDSLAHNGVILTNAHVSASVSGPSRAGILTGRYQQRSGYECNLDENFGLDTAEVTIANLFQDNGYHTYAIGKWHQGHLPKYHPNRRGFDDFYGFLEGSRSYFFKEKTYDAPNSTYKMEHNGRQVVFNDYLTYNLGNAASDFILNNGKSPFMMYLAFNAVHTPMEATTEDLARFAGHSRQKLAAMTYAVDKAIGQVIQALKKSGKYDNTIIFFLSDNGGAHDNQSSNYPLKGIKGTKFEGGIRVPYFITYPNKLLNGTTYNGLCSSLDIFATSAAVAGINTKQLKRPLDGVNLLPYLTRNNKGEPHDVLYWRKDDMSAVLSGNWKYIRVKGIGERLYNLKNDLVESVDCINNQPLLTKKLKQKLNKWETQLVNPPLWNEGTWIDVTKQMHKELMNNHRITEFTPKK